MNSRIAQKNLRVAATLIGTLAFALAGATRAQEPAASQPVSGGVIAVGDKAALEANLNNDVIVEGKVSVAAWSNSGKVMNIQFEDATESRFGAVVFLKNKEKIDTAFGGDATKAWTGAKLRVKGKLSEYGGKSEAMKGSLQIIITDPAQVTIVELPATQPAQ